MAKESKLIRSIIYIALSGSILFVGIGTSLAQNSPKVVGSNIDSTQIIINTLGWAVSFIISILSASFVYYIKTSITLTVSTAVASITQTLGQRSLEAERKWNELDKRIDTLRLECNREYLPKEDMKAEMAALRKQFDDLKEDLHNQVEDLKRMVDRRTVITDPPDKQYKRNND